MPGQDNLLEMRRLEALSNTIFGVAMTLLAYDLPRKQLTTDKPDWAALVVNLRIAFACTPARLRYRGTVLVQPPAPARLCRGGTRLAFIGNLLFLLSIVALPLSTGLYGRYPAAPDVIACSHFISRPSQSLTSILWLMAAVPRGDWGALALRFYSARVRGRPGGGVHFAEARAASLVRCIRFAGGGGVFRAQATLDFLHVAVRQCRGSEIRSIVAASPSSESSEPETTLGL